jgi:hypothetical protein
VKVFGVAGSVISRVGRPDAALGFAFIVLLFLKALTTYFCLRNISFFKFFS